MADILIQIHEADGTRLPSVPRVDIIVGNTFTFTAADGDAALHFSPDLLAVIEPNHAPFALLQAGQQLRYTFIAVTSGSHEVILQDPAAPAPGEFAPAPDSEQTHVVLRAGGAASVSVVSSDPVDIQANFVETSFEVNREITSNPIGT